MKILHISTHNENCGIGKYQEMYIAAMQSVDPEVTNVFFATSPNVMYRQSKPEFQETMERLSRELPQYDLVHIQHEFSFFSKGQLAEVVKRIKIAGKPLVSTIHTKPVLNTVDSSRFSPKWPIRKMRTELGNKRHADLVLPLAQSDLVIVHNSFARKQLIELGFNENRLIIKPIPVPSISGSRHDFSKEIEEIKNKINYQPSDFVFATVGYLSRVKGCMQIIKTLNLLPPRYKLLIFGGIHPRGGNDETLDEMSDFIVNYRLQDRVFISGFVENDSLLNAYASSVDLLVFPYLREYVSSSAALNNGFANEKAVLTFPLNTFKEVSLDGEQVMTFSESFSYYDLAKSIRSFTPDKIKKASLVSKRYKDAFSYKILAAELLELYKKLAQGIE